MCRILKEEDNEAMDREKVIKGLECCSSMNGYACAECPYSSECVSGEAEYQVGTAHLASDALAMLKEREWHMLTEDDDGIVHGLPGDDRQYIMTDGKDIWIDNYVDGVEDGIFLDSGRDIREITAWMYMPELPKKDRR